MTSLSIQLPDDAAECLSLTSRDDLGPALLMAAAVKFYEMGQLSAGAAARLAGIPKPLFLARLVDYGVDAINLSPEDLAKEARLE